MAEQIVCSSRTDIIRSVLQVTLELLAAHAGMTALRQSTDTRNQRCREAGSATPAQQQKFYDWLDER